MKTLTTTILILLMTLNSFAQGNRDRIKALKVSFITEKLNLTSKEAQEFWPIYNAYEEATRKIKHDEIRSIRKEIKENINTLSEAKSEELLNRLVAAETKLHNEDLDLVSKLKKIISSQKIIMLKVAEEDFNRKLFEQFKNKRDEYRKKD